MRPNTQHIAGLVLLLALPDHAAAGRTGWHAGQKGFCPFVRSAVTILHEQSAATSFCSSFLHISGGAPSTVQTTVTPTTTTTVTSTFTHVATLTSDSLTTNTVTTTVTTTGPSVAPTTVTRTATSTVPYNGCGELKRLSAKRDAAVAPTTPNCFSQPGWVATDLSAACSCLHISTQHGTGTTITHTAADVTVTTTDVVGTGVSKTSLQVSTAEVTQTVYSTISQKATTDTSTVTRTVTGPFILGYTNAITYPAGSGGGSSTETVSNFVSCPSSTTYPGATAPDYPCDFARRGDQFVLSESGLLIDVQSGSQSGSILIVNPNENYRVEGSFSQNALNQLACSIGGASSYGDGCDVNCRAYSGAPGSPTERGHSADCSGAWDFFFSGPAPNTCSDGFSLAAYSVGHSV